MPQQIRLSPSGEPIGWVGAPGDGVPFLRRYLAAWNTILYSASDTLTLIQGPAGENPALFGMVAPETGVYVAQLHFSLQVEYRTPTAPPAAQSNTLEVRIQVSEDNGGSWITPLWQGIGTSGNGLYQSDKVVTATQFTESVRIDADHVWTVADVNSPLLCRVAWLATGLETGFQEVFSSFANENGNTGGWSFEGFLAESV